MARNMSSVMLRGASHSARAPECDAMIGARVMMSVLKNVLSETCDTSTIMPSRFIS